jgi:glycosyltransferase involved in cell wall biosynthesis
MKVSVCLTVFNEEKSMRPLLESLLKGSKRAAEIVIVDAQSTDKTIDIIKHLRKKDRRIKLLVKKCSRAEGRNLAVDLAKFEIIAMTDAGCTVEKNWLKKLVEPFKDEKVDMVAGFYKMVGDTPLQKAFSVFLGTQPTEFDVNFMPSTRSIAFRKTVWEQIGGFPENLEDTAEDTVFTNKANEINANIVRVKNARVEWGMPENYSEGIRKMFNYAKGDAKSRIWRHSSKGLTSHNVKVVSIFLRYLFILFLLIYTIRYPYLLFLPFLLLLLYLIWSFRKVYIKTGSKEAGLWGIAIQIASDFAVMGGFLSGLVRLEKNL